LSLVQKRRGKRPIKKRSFYPLKRHSDVFESIWIRKSNIERRSATRAELHEREGDRGRAEGKWVEEKRKGRRRKRRELVKSEEERREIERERREREKGRVKRA